MRIFKKKHDVRKDAMYEEKLDQSEDGGRLRPIGDDLYEIRPKLL